MKLVIWFFFVYILILYFLGNPWFAVRNKRFAYWNPIFETIKSELQHHYSKFFIRCAKPYPVDYCTSYSPPNISSDYYIFHFISIVWNAQYFGLKFLFISWFIYNQLKHRTDVTQSFMKNGQYKIIQYVKRVNHDRNIITQV